MQSVAPLGVIPTTYNGSPKEVIAEFYKRDPAGDLDKISPSCCGTPRRSSRRSPNSTRPKPIWPTPNSTSAIATCWPRSTESSPGET